MRLLEVGNKRWAYFHQHGLQFLVLRIGYELVVDHIDHFAVQFYFLVDIGFIERLTSASNLCDTGQSWGNRISHSNQGWAVPVA